MPVMDTLHKADLVGELAGHHGEAVRSRSGQRARTERGDPRAIFDEEQIFRIDHFLGKEAAQNILAFRFANGLFEPIWNRNFIDHIQIDVPERLTCENRAEFYESVGAFKDMVVTHLFQILAFVAMEPPTELASEAISDEKNKVFRSMRPLDPTKVVRGQYRGYRDEPGVSAESDTETFVALKARSTTGAGRVSRSFCAPARAWLRDSASSPSHSTSRREACFQPDPVWDKRVRIT